MSRNFQLKRFRTWRGTGDEQQVRSSIDFPRPDEQTTPFHSRAFEFSSGYSPIALFLHQVDLIRIKACRAPGHAEQTGPGAKEQARFPYFPEYNHANANPGNLDGGEIARVKCQLAREREE
ncbi:hypothetical protein K0M31_016363 [Melipona bicolor]|uniref:Uncharacterized protein n=1 Tax=Melipona bicolor TaxID=60889 RepID=A0AA40G706_9HYME|nr:hypothetical protein K0M31_016363 [Melipona bicolor]